MSVQLEKDKIIITIDSKSPESQLGEIQSDIIFAMQSFDHQHISYNFYQLLNLLDAMLPDRKTYDLMDESFNYNMEPLRQTLKTLRPDGLVIDLIKATTYLYKYATVQEKRDIDLEDTIDMLKGLAETIQEGEKGGKSCQ